MKDIVFDFGNVIALFEPLEIYKKYSNDEETAKYLHDLLVEKEVWPQMDKGVTLEKIYRKTIRKVNPDYHHAIDRVLHEWIDYLDLDPIMVSYIKKLKEKGHRTYILSNISNQFYKIQEKYPEFFDYFDGIYISSNRGYIKPSYMAYLDFLKMNKLKAENCLFIDDKKENLENAEEIGFTVYHYDGSVESLKKFIEKID